MERFNDLIRGDAIECPQVGEAFDVISNHIDRLSNDKLVAPSLLLAKLLVDLGFERDVLIVYEALLS